MVSLALISDKDRIRLTEGLLLVDHNIKSHKSLKVNQQYVERETVDSYIFIYLMGAVKVYIEI